MKILTIGNYNGNLSIYEAQIKQFIIMSHKGIDVTIQGDFSEEIEKLLQLEKLPLIYDKPKNKKDLDFCHRLSQYITQNKVDIVHVFGGSNTANTCLALKHVNVKIIGYFGSTSIHWHDISSYKTYLNPRLDKIICISNDISKHFKKQLWGKHKNKIHTIYKGYDSKWFNNVIAFDYSNLNISEDAIIICSAAHHRPVKGMKYLMQATNHIESTKKIHFVFVGKNTQNKDLKKLASKSKFKNNIHLLGHRKDIKSIMKGADIYTQTSKNEGLGRAIIESMCLQKPCVVTDAGGCTELIDDGISGYIAKNKNPKSIAEKLNLLIDSKERRKNFGLEAYKRIETLFSIEKTVDETLALYKNLLND